jgi:hypothetical protein
VDWANYRIRNSDNFAAISDGHTPTAQEKSAGIEMPEVLGYSGPFYLGLLGDVDPKWAVYADEWIHNEDISRFNKLQRRSPEVWVNEPIEQRTMDPIAALGAETPRLDSGMNPYCRRWDNDQLVMRYSAMSFPSPAAFPGPSNSYIPDSERGRKSPKQRYGVSAMPKPDMNEPGTPDIGGAVARALEAVMPSIVQAVEQELAGGGDDVETEEPMNNPEPGETEPVPTPGAQGEPTNSGTVPVPRGDNEPGAEASLDEEPVAQPNPKPPGADEDARYKAQGPAIYGAYCAGKKSAMGAMPYARGSAIDPSIHKRLAKLEVENRQMRTELNNERQDLARYSRLVPLAQEFEFDPNDEMKTVIDMTDAQFDRHCDVTIKRYSKRDDITNLQIFDDPTVEVDQYGRGRSANEPTVEECHRYSMMAGDIAANKVASGQKTDWQTEYDALVSKKYPNAVAS